MSLLHKESLIAIPAYNEAENIERIINSVRGNMPSSSDLIVINDGSTDNTAGILNRLGVNSINLCVNSGYGVALQTGIKYALANDFQYIVFIDADGQHDPQNISQLLSCVMKDEADLVIGSRFITNTGYMGAMFRKLGSMFFSSLIYCFSRVKVKDPTSGFQALNAKAMRIYNTELFPMDYPDADMILLLIFHGLRIKEVPVHMTVNKKQSMHSGALRVLYYIYKMLLSILVVLCYRQEIKQKGK